MEYKTIKVRKSTVVLVVVFIAVMFLIFQVRSIYKEYAAGAERQNIDLTGMELIQFDPIPEGAVTALVSTDAGDMIIRLFTAETPNTCAKFIELAENGSLDGMSAVTYESGAQFSLDCSKLCNDMPLELHKNLWPYRGALCLDEYGNIIFINTTEFTDEDKEYLTAEGDYAEMRSAFLEHGGVPNYSHQMTVFGQVIEGEDVLIKISASYGQVPASVKSVTIENNN